MLIDVSDSFLLVMSSLDDVCYLVLTYAVTFIFGITADVRESVAISSKILRVALLEVP